MIKWGTQKEVETRRRIMVSIWAYAYEVRHHSIISDHRFDEECKLIDLKVNTDNPWMDIWFCGNFSPHTGSWIHNHPNLDRIAELYEAHYANVVPDPVPTFPPPPCAYTELIE